MDLPAAGPDETPERPRLLMWDVDLTLVRTGGVSRDAYARAFTMITGRALERLPEFAGRTERAIATDLFTMHGVVPAPLDRFFPLFAAEFSARRHLIPELGRTMPGAAEVIERLSHHRHVVQTLVTGNIPEVAFEKLAAFELTTVIDFEVGGYGTDDHDRAALVRRCLSRAEHKYRRRFPDVLVIGDTVHDVAAALANGATAIAVATGSTGAEALAAAGAHVVLPDLSDVPAVVRLLAGVG